MNTYAAIGTVAAGAGLLLYVKWKRSQLVLKAYCELAPGGKSCDGSTGGGVSGCVSLEQKPVGDHHLTTITYHVVGLTQGKHGFHIHDKADFSDGCKSAGGH